MGCFLSAVGHIRPRPPRTLKIPMNPRRTSCAPTHRGFTLVELLVVIGIIVLLVALLLPSINSARRDSRAVQCQSNVRQIATGLIAYAGVSNSRFPPNRGSPAPAQFWSDEPRIGQFVGPVATTGVTDASVYVCPEDEHTRRSYAMNVWASAQVDGGILAPPIKGIRWHYATPRAARMVLVVEAWSYIGTNAAGFSAPHFVGAGGTPGARLGGGGGITPINTSRWGPINSEVTYARHRRANGPGQQAEPRGRTVIAFGDGHVEILRNASLVDYETGQLTGLAYWSPLDFP